MIPDKIYTNNRGVYAKLPIFSQADANVEYIRKEALLEWLEQNRNQAQMWFDRYNDKEDLSAKQVWEKVIGKLNEM